MTSTRSCFGSATSISCIYGSPIVVSVTFFGYFLMWSNSNLISLHILVRFFIRLSLTHYHYGFVSLFIIFSVHRHFSVQYPFSLFFFWFNRIFLFSSSLSVHHLFSVKYYISVQYYIRFTRFLVHYYFRFIGIFLDYLFFPPLFLVHCYFFMTIIFGLATFSVHRNFRYSIFGALFFIFLVH